MQEKIQTTGLSGTRKRLLKKYKCSAEEYLGIASKRRRKERDLQIEKRKNAKLGRKEKKAKK